MPQCKPPQRTAFALLALAGVLALSPTLARAIEPDIPEKLVSEADVLAIHLQRRLADARSSEPGEREDRAALAAFYGERHGRTVWVTKDGLGQRARDVMAEIRRADDWGLRASAFELPDAPSSARGEPSTEALVEAEVKLSSAVLKYARHARGGRMNPAELSKNLDMAPQIYDPRSVMVAISDADAPGAYLRRLHPRHPQFEKLRQLWLASRGSGFAPRASAAASARASSAAPAVRIPAGPRLREGQTHHQVALVRQRLGVPAPDGNDMLFDGRLADAVAEFQRAQGLEPDGVITNPVRTALNGGAGLAASAPTGSAQAMKLLANMERWRYLPDDMGKFHVWVNVPEFLVRVVKDGKPIHTERIVAGKTDTQTAVFSAHMQEVIFHPYWNVPNSIKVKEIGPYLGGSNAVLQKHGLKIKLNGRDIDPGSVNWSAVDVRNYHFYQPPGGQNVLGIVKFAFPNKHDIYMHDTTSKTLFNAEVRTFSHGCMRVRDPKKLAEAILREDKGWDTARIEQLVASGQQDNRIGLSRRVAVHVTYFTAWVDDTGKTQYRDDIYGHDSRMIAAFEGKPVRLIAQEDAAKEAQRESRARVPDQRRQRQYETQSPNAGNFFNFNWLMN